MIALWSCGRPVAQQRGGGASGARGVIICIFVEGNEFRFACPRRSRECASRAPRRAVSAERAICLGVLAGKKTEEIAHDLGLAPCSVATYPSRAYPKFGFNRRGALFALCRDPVRPAP